MGKAILSSVRNLKQGLIIVHVPPKLAVHMVQGLAIVNVPLTLAVQGLIMINAASTWAEKDKHDKCGIHITCKRLTMVNVASTLAVKG